MIQHWRLFEWGSTKVSGGGKTGVRENERGLVESHGKHWQVESVVGAVSGSQLSSIKSGMKYNKSPFTQEKPASGVNIAFRMNHRHLNNGKEWVRGEEEKGKHLFVFGESWERTLQGRWLQPAGTLQWEQSCRQNITCAKEPEVWQHMSDPVPNPMSKAWATCTTGTSWNCEGM